VHNSADIAQIILILGCCTFVNREGSQSYWKFTNELDPFDDSMIPTIARRRSYTVELTFQFRCGQCPARNPLFRAAKFPTSCKPKFLPKTESFQNRAIERNSSSTQRQRHFLHHRHTTQQFYYFLIVVREAVGVELLANSRVFGFSFLCTGRVSIRKTQKVRTPIPS
jgi:hypothetical protein